MARCDQGYLCEVCGGDVGEITDSDLYLRYVLGAIGPGQLMHARERHIRCNPVQAQYIVDDRFEPVVVEGPFDKRLQEADATLEEEARITRAWRRLQEIPSLGIPITEYPLSEVRARQRSDRS